MGKDITNGHRESTQRSSSGATVITHTKAFAEFRKTLEKEIEDTLLQKMRAFTDEILKARLR